MMNNEIEYLKNLIIDLSIVISDLKIPYSHNKNIIGIITPDDKKFDLSEYYSKLTLIDSCKYLSLKICFSLNLSLKYTYSKEVYNEYSLFKSDSKIIDDEFLAYYYIENAIFRNVTLWDNLAQLYNLHYELNESPNRILYKTFFKKYSHKKNFSKIVEYLDESNNIDGINEKWKGNHAFLNDYRNKMTHRNSPDISSLSNFDLNLPNHPSFILKRLCEDYNTVIEFLLLIINEISEEFCIKNT